MIEFHKKLAKKNTMVIAATFLCFSTALSAFATNFDFLLVCRIAQGIFVPGITAIMLSYVQKLYPKQLVGFGMGVYMAATSCGAVIGRLLAGWITFISSWQSAFFTFSILLAIAIFVMLVAFPKNEQKYKDDKTIIDCSFVSYFLNFKFICSLILPMVVFFSFMAISTFATYRLALPPFSLDANNLGNVFLVLLVGVIVSPIAGRLSDSIGLKKILFLGIFLLALGILTTTAEKVYLVVIGIGCLTVGMYAVQSVAPMYISRILPTSGTRTPAVLYQTFFI